MCANKPRVQPRHVVRVLEALTSEDLAALLRLPGLNVPILRCAVGSNVLCLRIESILDAEFAKLPKVVQAKLSHIARLGQ